MKKSVKMVLPVFLAFMMFLSFVHVTMAANINFKVEGKEFYYPETVIVDGRTLIPVRQFSELIGANVIWDGANKQVLVTKGKLHFVLNIDNKRVIYQNQEIYMDSPAVIKDARTYAPVRFIAEALYHKVSWDSLTKTVFITEKPSYIINEGDTLYSISQGLNISIENLMTWNYLDSDNILFGEKLFLEPIEFKSIEARPVVAYNDEDLELLAKIVYAEARDEPYDGLVAVASVVLNRVKSPNFPNSIHDVIYQTGQFTPARTGKLTNLTPDSSSYQAAKDALYGDDPVSGALYFFNPAISDSTFFSKKDYVKDIGNHSFYR